MEILYSCAIVLTFVVSKWLQGNRASQSLWKHILFLPLLHIVSFPKEQAGLLGPVFKQNLQVAGSLLSNLVDISDSPHCSISSVSSFVTVNSLLVRGHAILSAFLSACRKHLHHALHHHLMRNCAQLRICSIAFTCKSIVYVNSFIYRIYQ